MKKATQKAAILLLLLGGFLCQAQETSEVKKALVTARLQLMKGRKNYNPEAGLATYLQLAAQGNAEAMNALGLVYSKGLGVPVNETQGIQWFNRAAEAGYAKGWYNMGTLIKESDPVKAISYFEKGANAGYPTAYAAWGRMLMKGNGVPQNYPQAISVFKQGAENGNAYCNYSLGYLYYKGFGCAQDYSQAVQQFEIAAQKKNSWAMYMLGLCYRNGYGVSIDLEKAKYWLNKSAAMGENPSQKELDDPEAENTNPRQTITISKPIDEVITITEADAPDTFKKVKQASITDNISGSYTGSLFRYDFSGQNIISSTPLEINLHQEEKQLTGEWKETRGDTVAFAAQIHDNAIVFKDSRIDRTEHFYKGRFNTYEFKEAQLQLLQTDESLLIIGNLQLYNIEERENEKPMFIILEKKQSRPVTTASEILSRIVVYPNPFESSFQLSFDLTETTNVTASVHSLSGQLLYTTQWDNLSQGTLSKTISLNALSGYYVLRLNYGQDVKTAILIKK